MGGRGYKHIEAHVGGITFKERRERVGDSGEEGRRRWKKAGVEEVSEGAVGRPIYPFAFLPAQCSMKICATFTRMSSA